MDFPFRRFRLTSAKFNLGTLMPFLRSREVPSYSFDADTQRHCAASRAGELTSRGATPTPTSGRKTNQGASMLFRRTADTEDLVALTALIRAAYAPHALKGL